MTRELSTSSLHSAATRVRRPSGLLDIRAVSARERPKGAVATEGGCCGVLTVGGTKVEAMDGHLLGLAAWVLNAGAATVQVSTRPGMSWRVKSNAGFGDREIDQLCHSVRRPERDKAWFLLRFQTALYVAHNSHRQPVSAVEAWEEQSLDKVLALVPEAVRVNKRLARASRYDSEGRPAAGATRVVATDV